MKTVFTHLPAPALISFLLVLPFLVLEVVNRSHFQEGFPILLFVFLWLLPMLFLLTVKLMFRNVRAGDRILANPGAFLLRVVFLLFIAWIWFGVMLDQMPCFLGTPNCD